MTENEVHELAVKGQLAGQPLHGDVVDTHISWVILTEDFAFKIKKPIKLSFLDYTSLESRKDNCDKEIILNSRYSPIYQSVIPIKLDKGRWFLGGEEGEIMDYAVKMKRMDSARQMDNMLKNSEVTTSQIDPLAELIGSFHNNANITHHPFILSEASQLFNDLEQVIDFVSEELGATFKKIIIKSIVWSDDFLRLHHKRLEERIEDGFQRDVHGDLHSGNIFLYDTPILFDGIEFNEEFRQIDMLYEVAFLCMDLEAFDQADLARNFLNAYTQIVPCMVVEEDHAIFNYYKCLRANIRAKVHAVGARQAHDESSKSYHLEETKKYLLLMNRYMKDNVNLHLR